MNRTFRLDKRNARLMGVCAGIADATGLDALLVRLALVLLTLCLLGPVTLVAYLVVGLCAAAGE